MKPPGCGVSTDGLIVAASFGMYCDKRGLIPGGAEPVITKRIFYPHLKQFMQQSWEFLLKKEAMLHTISIFL